MTVLLALALALGQLGTPMLVSRPLAEHPDTLVETRSQDGAVAGSIPAKLALDAPLGAVGTVAIGGNATWFANPQGEGQAAAGPALRDALGSDWRGSVVTVTASGHSVTVRLTDWCACGSRHGKDTLLDLDRADFAKLAPLSAGVVAVTVELLPTVTLPPTDTAMTWQEWHEVVM